MVQMSLECVNAIGKRNFVNKVSKTEFLVSDPSEILHHIRDSTFGSYYEKENRETCFFCTKMSGG